MFFGQLARGHGISGRRAIEALTRGLDFRRAGRLSRASKDSVGEATTRCSFA